MGTTVVGAMFSPREAADVHRPRRRLALLSRPRAAQIQLLTRDHSLINDYLLAMPDLTDEQKSELPKNVITRALGMQDHVVVDLQHDDPHAGDVYVLCSDGLSRHGPDDDIASDRHARPTSARPAASLIQRANERGGEDNITAVLIKIERGRRDRDAGARRRQRRERAETAPTRAANGES